MSISQLNVLIVEQSLTLGYIYKSLLKQLGIHKIAVVTKKLSAGIIIDQLDLIVSNYDQIVNGMLVEFLDQNKITCQKPVWINMTERMIANSQESIKQSMISIREKFSLAEFFVPPYTLEVFERLLKKQFGIDVEN
jgi:hypothetical protein